MFQVDPEMKLGKKGKMEKVGKGERGLKKSAVTTASKEEMAAAETFMEYVGFYTYTFY